MRGRQSQEKKMPTKDLIQVLDLMKEKGKLVESYIQTQDEVLKQKLNNETLLKTLINTSYTGRFACAALCYRWIARQLLRGKIITEQAPGFSGQTFSEKKKEKIAKIQQTYVFFLKSGLVDAVTPYEGLIPSKDRIVHYRVAGEGFKRLQLAVRF
jgi:hypothetical protein